MVDRLEVLDVLVGRPASIGTAGDREVTSAIRKHPVAEPLLTLAATNLAGDEQADRSVHGGVDKAVYCYPSDHVADWVVEGFDLAAGSFGENVVLAGGVETDVRIGDRWRWGSALVQISQPRAPCFKFALHTGRKDAGPRMIATGRSGWYLRVLEPGTVETRGAIELVSSDDRAPTVADCFAVMFPGLRAEADDAAIVARVVACPTLSEEWLGGIVRRNHQASGLAAN